MYYSQSEHLSSAENKAKKEQQNKDSIAEYENIISDKLEKKRKEELQRASENMKIKLVKTGRCPICTLSPP